jgi:hypothetical protein
VLSALGPRPRGACTPLSPWHSMQLNYHTSLDNTVLFEALRFQIGVTSRALSIREEIRLLTG